MRILNFTFETTLRFSEPVESHDFVLRCLPRTTPLQTVLESQLILAPGANVSAQRDGFGNELRIGRIEQPHEEFDFIASGLVVVDETPAGQREFAHPVFERFSPRAFADEAIREFSGDVLRVMGNASPMTKACRLSRALHERMEYVPGATDVSTTAAQAFAAKRGVCQDFAHVLIASCRSAGVAARYVNGLMVGEGATHAWVEVYDDEYWRGIDPTNDCLVNDGYIAFSHGRDFSDCPIEAGVFRGGARQDQCVSVSVSGNDAMS